MNKTEAAEAEREWQAESDARDQDFADYSATLAKIRTIVADPAAALVVGRVLAALDEGSTQPEGSKS